MNTRIKTSLIIAVTLLVGMVLGALISGIVGKYYFRKTAFRMRTPEGFITRFERIIQPNDDQRDAIRKVLEKHHQKIMRFRRKVPDHMDSLWKELEPILTKEQKTRLEERSFFRRRKRHRPPLNMRSHRHLDRPVPLPDSLER